MPHKGISTPCGGEGSPPAPLLGWGLWWLAIDCSGWDLVPLVGWGPGLGASRLSGFHGSDGRAADGAGIAARSVDAGGQGCLRSALALVDL